MASKRQSKKARNKNNKIPFKGPFNPNKDADLHYLRKNMPINNTEPTIEDREIIGTLKTTYTKKDSENIDEKSLSESSENATIDIVSQFDSTQKINIISDNKSLKKDKVKYTNNETNSINLKRESIEDKKYYKLQEIIRNNPLLSIIITLSIGAIIYFLQDYYRSIGRVEELSGANKKNIEEIKDDIKDDIKEINKNIYQINFEINDFKKDFDLINYKYDDLKEHKK